MPYPNYHAARIKSPGSFTRIRVINTSKEGIIFYGGPLKSTGKSTLQSIKFPKSKYSVLEAKKWLSSHNHKPIKFEPASSSTKKSKWPSISEREEL